MLILPCLWKGVDAAFVISEAQEMHIESEMSVFDMVDDECV